MLEHEPIPKEYQKGYNGCPPSPPDSRDIPFGAVLQPVFLPSWQEGSGFKPFYSQLKVEHQGTTLSCVSQAFSKYLELLNLFDTGEVKDLSARYIYSQIYLPQGGAYIRDGAKIATKQGDCEEKLMSSYMPNGNPPSEMFMRGRLEGKQKTVKDNAYIYHSKLNYSWIADGRDFEILRQAIYQYKGFISGFNGHCVFFVDWGQDEKGMFLIYINSYGNEIGENGLCKYYKNNPYQLYDIMVLVDAPNNLVDTTKMLARLIFGGDQFLKKENKIYRIPDEDTLKFLVELGIIPNEMQEITSLTGFDIQQDFPSIKVYNELKNLLPLLEDALKANRDKTEAGGEQIIDKIINYFKNLFQK